ncbi:MAG: hypothetical protein JWO63_860 [Frankiales bacterium]|nr:hypothetical protein [Frankiales bacterium]
MISPTVSADVDGPVVVGAVAFRMPAAVDIGVDVFVSATRQAKAVGRVGFAVAAPLAGLALRPARLLQRRWSLASGPVRAEQGRQLRLAGEQQAVEFVSRWLPVIIDRALDRVDVTQLVLDHVQLERIIARLDVVGIAREVIDELDLPEIIRESSSSMASETVVGVRLRGVEADERVGRILDRVLLRRNSRVAADGVGPDGLA